MSRIKDMQRQTGFSKEAKRSPEDYYITPDVAIEELLKREKFEGLGWEPACGNGAISKFFPDMIVSDIRTDDTVIGERGIDFLNEYRKVDYIVTNPPFSIALEFVKQALLCADKAAIFCRIQFLEGQERYKFFKENPPKRVYVFSNRVSCYAPSEEDKRILKKEHGIMCFCWYIWEKGYKGKPEINWIFFEDKVASERSVAKGGKDGK